MASDHGWTPAGHPDEVNPFGPPTSTPASAPGPSFTPFGPPAAATWPVTPAAGYPQAAHPGSAGYPPPTGYGTAYGNGPAYGPGPLHGYPAVVFPGVPLPPLATWAQRAGSFLADAAVPTVLNVVGLAVWLPEYIRFVQTIVATAAANHGAMPAVPLLFSTRYLVMLLLSLVAAGFNLWNRTFRQGRTGQSIGKRLLGIRLLGEQTMAPVGPGTSFLRELAHYVDSAAMDIGYLWPLWDAKRQTFADKICRTVVVADGPPRGF